MSPSNGDVTFDAQAQMEPAPKPKTMNLIMAAFSIVLCVRPLLKLLRRQGYMIARSSPNFSRFFRCHSRSIRRHPSANRFEFGPLWTLFMLTHARGWSARSATLDNGLDHAVAKRNCVVSCLAIFTAFPLWLQRSPFSRIKEKTTIGMCHATHRSSLSVIVRLPSRSKDHHGSPHSL